MAATAAGIRISLVAATMLAATSAPAADTWQIGGNLRVGYVASETRARDGAESDADSFRTRARVHLRADPGNGWRFGVRVAGRFDSGQDDSDFWMRTWAPGPSGLVDGQATFDEAWLEHAPVDARWSLRLGRFQASFGLDDVMKKSLDQNDSTNFDITWTDGAWWQWRGDAWTTHAIIRHNDRRGPTGTLRPPLEFSDDGSRASGFFAIASNRTVGPFVQRMLTVNWLPSALRRHGVADPDARDYLAVTAKTTAQWPLGDTLRLRLGAEIGHAFDTPRRETMGSGAGDADGLAWQLSANLLDFAPGQRFGLIWSRVPDGWLLSSDFRPNDTQAEARWVWQAHPALQLDARIRRREEVRIPDDAGQPRRDLDIYLRSTWTF